MPSPDIVNSIVDQWSKVTLADSPAVDAFFLQRKNLRYIPWFNAALSNRGAWAKVKLEDSKQNDLFFHQFWNQIDEIFGGDCTLIQFVSLMSIICNEQSGIMSPVSEKMGIAGHPGMSYLFDKIGGKRSYNTADGNKTAFACFNDEDFIATHGTLTMAALARTTDARWAHEVWPAGTPTNMSAAGFVAEADFTKFRGRGLIQTTLRSNYKSLVKFVQNYAGENNTIDFYKLRWQGMSLDQAATVSTNEDWDRLFQQTDMIIATEAVKVHSANSNGYLKLSKDAAKLNGKTAGSVYYMGLRISGGEGYAEKYKQRVTEVLNAI